MSLWLVTWLLLPFVAANALVLLVGCMLYIGKQRVIDGREACSERIRHAVPEATLHGSSA